MKTQQTYEEAIFERTRERSSIFLLRAPGLCGDSLPRAELTVLSLNGCADPYHLSSCSHVEKGISYVHVEVYIQAHKFYICVLYSLESHAAITHSLGFLHSSDL